jgi:hypothetical protein
VTPQLDAMLHEAPALLLRLLLAAATSMGPIIRRFLCLGLNRWATARHSSLGSF